jgi:hypothetical protein
MIYSLETQHYYHVLNKGSKFKYILDNYKDLFNKIKDYCFEKKLLIQSTCTQVNKNDLIGNIDFICSEKNQKKYYDIKCCSDITLKQILQQAICQILYNDLDEKKGKQELCLNFINLLTGKKTTILMVLTDEKIKKILEIMNENKKSKG